jgi:hypothetical protein
MDLRSIPLRHGPSRRPPKRAPKRFAFRRARPSERRNASRFDARHLFCLDDSALLQLFEDSENTIYALARSNREDRLDAEV